MAQQSFYKKIVIMALGVSIAITTLHEKQAYALPRPQTLAVMAGLYTIGATVKNYVKELSHDNIKSLFGVKDEDFNQELAIKSVAKMLERGFWAVVAFATHDGLIFVGLPAPDALSATLAFGTGLTLPFTKDILNNLKKWYDTLNKNEHAVAIKQWYYQPHYDLVYPIKTTHTTQAYCGPQNPYCVHDELERPLQHLTWQTSVTENKNTVTFPWNDFIALAPAFATETGIMLLGYQIGLQSHKLGSDVGSHIITNLVPGHDIFTANEYMKIAFIAKKMISKYIESYLPGKLYHQLIKPAVTEHTDPQTVDHEDFTYLVGLLGEIFVYVPFTEHTKELLPQLTH